MKKTLLLATLISSYSFAQTVIMDQSNEPAIGDLKTMYTCDSLTDPLESTTGNGVTWDYTQLVGLNGTRNLIVIDPATSPYSSIYTNSTKGYNIEGSLTNFYNSTSTERQSQGFIFEEPSFGTVIAHFDVNEQKTVSYPFANGDSFTDNFSGNLSFTFNGLAQNPSCTGRSYASIDGQGTLLLPSSTTIQNVIRYKIKLSTPFSHKYRLLFRWMLSSFARNTNIMTLPMITCRYSPILLFPSNKRTLPHH